jgi:Type II secretion system (T2SS), protein K
VSVGNLHNSIPARSALLAGSAIGAGETHRNRFRAHGTKRYDARRMRGRSEDGIALIAVLWVLTLLSVIVLAFSFVTRISARIARNMTDIAAARAAADAGVQRAILDLVTIPDRKKFRTDGTPYWWSFASSKVRVSVQDEASKVDLNKGPEAALAALFESAGVDTERAQSLADAVADFRDPDNLVRPRGAEEADYRSAGLAWSPKNTLFQSIEELQQVLGMSTDIYRRVAPDLTIYSVDEAQAFFGSPSRTYSIRAKAEGPDGGTFIREAVVRLRGGILANLLVWRQGA